MNIYYFWTHTFCINSDDEGELTHSLVDDGVRILRIDGSKIVDEESFFEEVVRNLPLEPQIHGISLDALADSLWEGLANLNASRVAIIWTHADRILNSDMQFFIEAVYTLRDVAKALSSTSSGLPAPVSLSVFLLGETVGFGSFDSFIDRYGK